MPRYRIEEYVRMEDTDAAGIVHFQSYFRFFGRAETEMFRYLGLNFEELIRLHGVSFPRAHVECDFKRPLRLDQLVAVDVSIAEARRSSLTLRFEMRLSGREEIVCTAKFVIVAVNMRDLRPEPIPQSLLATLSPYMD